MKLTQKQEQLYVDRGGSLCPFCEADNPEGGDIDIEYGAVYQEIRCLSCGEKWTDVYSLDHIYQMED